MSGRTRLGWDTADVLAHGAVPATTVASADPRSVRRHRIAR
jgi:hypothetical protein